MLQRPEEIKRVCPGEIVSKLFDSKLHFMQLRYYATVLNCNFENDLQLFHIGSDVGQNKLHEIECMKKLFKHCMYVCIYVCKYGRTLR